MMKFSSNRSKRKEEMANHEQILVDRINGGDPSAFQEFVERYKKKIYFLAFDLIGDHHDAEDISQEVFIKVFRSLKNFRRNSKMSSWLYQITVNASIDALRKKSIKPQEVLKEVEKVEAQAGLLGSGLHAENPARSAEASLIQEHISRALKKVSPKERAIFVMRHYNDLDTKEIAEILKVSQGTVKSFLFRAIRKLRKELSPYFGHTGLEVADE